MITAEKENIQLENNFFTTISPLLITFGEGKLPDMHKDILSTVHTLFGQAVASILSNVQAGLQMSEQEVVFQLPLHPDRKKEEAEKLIQQEKNSYNLFKTEGEGAECVLYFRLAALKEKGGKMMMSTTLSAAILQGLLRNWVRNAPDELPQCLKDGAYQKAAESINSFIELWYGGDAAGKQPSYPDTSERDPVLRMNARTTALHNLVQMDKGLEYAKKRDVMPGMFKDNDSEGDRLICITPEWIEFTRNPKPKRFPVFFTNSSKGSPVQLFRRNNGRIYAFLPLLTARKGILMPCSGQKTDWWYARKDEFVPLNCSNPQWPKSGTGIMLPLGMDSTPHLKEQKKGWIEHYLSLSGGIGTISIKEISSPHPGRTGVSGKTLHKKGTQKTEWKLDIALRLSGSISLAQDVYAIHFAKDSVVYWRDSQSGQVGHLTDWSVKVSQALEEKEKMESEQKKYKSVAGKQFFQKNKAWTRDLARKIIDQACINNASLIVEEITWVDKSKGGAEANRRFSMWNYSDLLQCLQHQANKAGILLVTVSDYQLKKEIASVAGTAKDKDWWRAYADAPPEDITAMLVKMGQKKIEEKIKRIEEKQ